MSRNLKLTVMIGTVLVALSVCCDVNSAQDSSRTQSSAGQTPSVSNTIANNRSEYDFDPTSGLNKDDPWEDKIVTPGIGTDSVRLGMSREELIATLGEPNDQNDYDAGCIYSHMHWFYTNADGSVDGDGIFTFLKDGKVFETRFGEGFQTKSGIGDTTKLEDLKAIVIAPLYRLIPSRNTATNHEDLYFMIEKDKGIAYEIAAGYKTKERAVSAIYVFYPNGDLLPWGCIDENQNLTAIAYP